MGMSNGGRGGGKGTDDGGREMVFFACDSDCFFYFYDTSLFSSHYRESFGLKHEA